MPTKKEELELDIGELRELLISVQRQRTRDALNAALQTANGELQKVERQTAEAANSEANAAKKPPAPATTSAGHQHILPVKKFPSFAWDQSEKFVKIYLSLSGVHDASEGQLKFDVTDTSINLRLSAFNNCHYEYTIKGLMDHIVPDKSYYKLKKDTVLVMLKKLREMNTWSHLTAFERKEEDARSARYKQPANSDDPNAGIMNMMKQMYDEGDDDMKRMIRKTWHENQTKKDAKETLLDSFQ